MRLLDATQQGLDPDYTVANAGTGLRAGQIAAWGDKPCHGDMFHVRQQCETAANVLARLAQGSASRCEALTLHRICPLRVALQRQRDDALGFAIVGDGKLASIAQRRSVPLAPQETDVEGVLATLDELHTQLGAGFVGVVADVRAAMYDTPRSSSMVKNLNSRLRRYFFLRRHLSDVYLSLLQLLLNHRVFTCDRRTERVGKTPKQLLTGQADAHWLELLGFQRLAIA